MSKEIIVVTAAYGADTVKQLGGQLELLETIKKSGADGVEIRHELLLDSDNLIDISNKIKSLDLFSVYSVPMPLLNELGHVDLVNVQKYINEAEILSARFLKLPLGSLSNRTDLAGLSSLLANTNVRLVIENDQTVEGGRVAPLITFFGLVVANRLPIEMTFDMANWHWLEEDAFAAAQALASHVAYIHVKASQKHQNKVKAIALDDSDGRWEDLIALLPKHVARGIEFPLVGNDLTAVTQHYVSTLKEI